MNNTTSIKDLKTEIAKQRQLNIELFHSIPVASHGDPLNKKAEPILKEWRAGSEKIKRLINELQELELSSNTDKTTEPNNNSFVNSFGEATQRDITCSTYERAENRNKKAILSFIGGK
jgi:hypothetical protein